jgi:hypothetical protein
MIAAISVRVVKHHFQAISRLTCLSSGENKPTGLGFSSLFSESPFCCALSLGRSGEFRRHDIRLENLEHEWQEAQYLLTFLNLVKDDLGISCPCLRCNDVVAIVTESIKRFPHDSERDCRILVALPKI